MISLVLLARDRAERALLAVGFGDIEPDRRRQDLRDGLVRHRGCLALLDQFARRIQQIRRCRIDPGIGIVAQRRAQRTT